MSAAMETCHFPKPFPQGFSKRFLHPEGRGPSSAYGIVSAPRKAFSGCRQVLGDAGARARAVEPRSATFASRAISRYPPWGAVFEGRRAPVAGLGARAARRLGPSMTI